jgi:hypothetical protein
MSLAFTASQPGLALASIVSFLKCFRFNNRLSHWYVTFEAVPDGHFLFKYDWYRCGFTKK